MDHKRLEKLSPLLCDVQLAERFLAEAHDATASVAYLVRAKARKAELEAHMSRAGAMFERSINWREADGRANGATFVLEHVIKGWLDDHGCEPSLRIAAAVLREAVRLCEESGG